jgi:hypothetical protein
MKKPFLLIAGWDYYPYAGTGDWQGCYETYEDAVEASMDTEILGKNWCKIVDLRKWTE